MTDKQLRRLSRGELLEMLIAEMERSEALEEKLRAADEKLAVREIAIRDAGTMAEAALKLNGVFEAAEAAGAQYVENLARLCREQETMRDTIEAEIREKCDAMWEETKVRCGELETGTMRRCSEMIEWAERESQRYWDDVNDRLGEFCAAHKELEGFLGELQPLRRAAS